MPLSIASNTLSANFVSRLLAAVARTGVDVGQVLEQVGVDAKLLSGATSRIEREAFFQIILVLMQQTEDEFLGFGHSRKSKPGTFSMMAHAVINCPNLEKAMHRSLQFYDLFDLGLAAKIEVAEGEATVRFAFPDNVEYQDIMVEVVFFISLRFMSWLVGQPVEPTRLCFSYPEDYHSQDKRADYLQLFPFPVQFGTAQNELVLPRELLSLPLVQNALSLSTFLRHSLVQLVDGNFHSVGLVAQIRAIISKEFGNQFPDFSVISEKLNMSPQTLRRRLKEGDTSYQEIKDNIRKDASLHYLSKPELSIDEIALLMGFSEASSFHRAFKKWTGMTPSAYRQQYLSENKGGS